MKIKDIREVSRRAKTELQIFIHHLIDNGYDLSILGDNIDRVIKRAYPQYGNEILDHYEIDIDHLELFFKLEDSEVYAHFVGTLYLGVFLERKYEILHRIAKYPVKFKLKVFNDLNFSRINSNVLEEIYLDIYTM